MGGGGGSSRKYYIKKREGGVSCYLHGLQDGGGGPYRNSDLFKVFFPPPPLHK